MRIELFASLAALLLATALAQTAWAAPSAAELEQAGNLFAITCSSAFCHGEGGVGARGPSLRNRDFMPNFVRTTILNGRSGTPMPSFKGSLSDPEINLIVAYVMSLSPNNHAAGSSAATATPAVLPLSPQAQQGSAIFFDTSRPGGCALCHSYGGQGGPVGPDLAAVAKKTPREIYQALIRPAGMTADYPAAAVTTRDGQRIAGILKQQTERVVQLYDLSSRPPVLRSFYPADGVTVDPAGAGPPYAHDLAGDSRDQIAAVIAFLKSADEAAPKDVTPQDLAQP